MRRNIAPLLVALLVVAAIGAVGTRLGNDRLEQAIDDRIAERVALVDRFSLAGDRLYDPQPTIDLVNGAPFVDADDPANARLLELFQVNPASDPLVGVALVRIDGTVLAARSFGMLLDPDALAPALSAASGGQPGLTRAFRVTTELVWARTFPVGGDQPWGAIVMVESLDDGWLQRLYEDLGSMGSGAGGLTLVDRAGAAAASWDPQLRGRQVLDPERLAALDEGTTVWTEEVGGRPTIHVAATRRGPHAGTVLLFHQAEQEFLGDLRTTQRQRDVALLAMLGASVLLLGLFSLQRQRAVGRDERRAEVVLAASDDMIAVIDRAGSIASVSSGIERLLGLRPGEWIGRPLAALVVPEHREQVSSALERTADVGQAATLGVSMVGADGTAKWFDLTFIDRHDDERVGGIVATCSEIEDRKALEDSLAHDATHDPLTGLANRARFDAILESQLDGRTDGVLGVVDLDRFKALNDQLGHDAGDDALRALGSILRTHIDPIGYPARLGGDEFAFWVEGLDDARLDAMCRGLISSIEAIWPGGLDGPNLSASIGLARARAGAETASALLREADRAMYAAKAQGGGAHRLASPVDAAPVGDHVNSHHAPDADEEIADDEPLELPALRASNRSWRGQRRRDVLTLALVVALLGGLAVGIVGMAAHAQQRAERGRVADRLALLDSLAATGASTTSANNLVGLAAQIPVQPDNAELTESVLDVWVLAPALGGHATVTMVDRAGDTIASSPRDADVPAEILTDGPHWASVLDGVPWIPPMATASDGRLRFYWVIPVVDEGLVARVLIVGSSVRDNNWSDVQARIGSLGPFPGGATGIDSNGLASMSWDPSRVGDLILDPALLTDLSVGDHLELVVEGDDGREQTMLVVRFPDPLSDRFMVWTVATDDLFADLRSGQGLLNAALAGSAGVTVVGLAVANRRREKLLRVHSGRLHALLQRSSTIVAIVDQRGTLEFVSSAAAGYTGIERRQLEGQPLERLLGPATEQVRMVIDDAIPGSEIRLRSVSIPDGASRPRVFDVGVVDLTGHPAVGGTLLTLRDRTDRHALEERLRDKATHDPLTRLPNRASFAQALEEVVDGTTDGSGSPGGLAVVFIDLDRFKPVNDMHGHQVGDEVLRVVAGRLAAEVRTGDLVARHGGDEFTILLRGCDTAEAERMTGRLLEAVRRPIRIGTLEVSVGASAGVVVAPGGTDQVGHLLRSADQAMYQAKRSGRDQWSLGELADRV